MKYCDLYRPIGGTYPFGQHQYYWFNWYVLDVYRCGITSLFQWCNPYYNACSIQGDIPRSSPPVSPHSHFPPPTLDTHPMVLYFEKHNYMPHIYPFTQPILYTYLASICTYLQPELIHHYSPGPYSTYFSFYCSTVDSRAISVVAYSHFEMYRAP